MVGRFNLGTSFRVRDPQYTGPLTEASIKAGGVVSSIYVAAAGCSA